MAGLRAFLYLAASPVKNHRQGIGKTMFFASHVRTLFPISFNHLFLRRATRYEFLR